jgi:hypothetical protein
MFIFQIPEVFLRRETVARPRLLGVRLGYAVVGVLGGSEFRRVKPQSLAMHSRRSRPCILQFIGRTALNCLRTKISVEPVQHEDLVSIMDCRSRLHSHVFWNEPRPALHFR